MSGEYMSLADASALVGDDIAYWLGNPFMPPDLLEQKVCWWLTQADARYAGLVERVRALADELNRLGHGSPGRAGDAYHTAESQLRALVEEGPC